MDDPDKLLNEVSNLGRYCLESFPVIILGSGASIPYGLPSMEDLREEIKNTTLPEESSLQKNLDELQKLLQRNDIETALSTLQTYEELQQFIRNVVWKTVNEADIALRNNLLNGNKTLGLSKLYDHLFGSTHGQISVVTPNYDRLAEYAADLNRNFWFTGFTHGHICTPKDPSPSLTRRARIQAGHDKHIKIWKVHGSLDWFKQRTTNAIKALPNCEQIPSDMLPAIIPPSSDKYLDTHQEPYRTIMANADNDLKQAKSYLCIGYGFNDDHIQPKLIERWKAGSSIPLLILTKKLSYKAHEILKQNNQLKFLALEEGQDGPNSTRMFSTSFPEGEPIAGHSLWKIEDFLEHTTGG